MIVQIGEPVKISWDIFKSLRDFTGMSEPEDIEPGEQFLTAGSDGRWWLNTYVGPHAEWPESVMVKQIIEEVTDARLSK